MIGVPAVGIVWDDWLPIYEAPFELVEDLESKLMQLDDSADWRYWLKTGALMPDDPNWELNEDEFASDSV